MNPYKSIQIPPLIGATAPAQSLPPHQPLSPASPASLPPQPSKGAAGGTGAGKVYFTNLYKDICLKSKVKNVAKHYIYLDVLLTVPIYVINHYS